MSKRFVDALSLASENGNIDMVIILATSGATKESIENALLVAKEHKQNSVVEYLSVKIQTI